MLGKIDLRDRSAAVRLREQNKFSSDSFFASSNGCRIWTEGVFLNAEAMTAEYGKNSLPDTVAALLADKAERLSEKLFGTYLLFAETGEACFLCNDLLSKRSVFYTVTETEFLFSDVFSELAAFARENGVTLSPDPLAVKMAARLGQLFDDVTYAREIRFLRPFESVRVDAHGVHIVQCALPTEKIGSEKELLARTEALFAEGTRLQFEKNRAYGYRQVTTLSGGMDSRATFLHGKKLGCDGQFCFTYAEPGSLDESIARSISAGEGAELFFHSLSGGTFIMDRDKLAAANDAQMTYVGTTGLLDCLSNLPTADWGIVHTGVGGGEVMGDVCWEDEESGWNDWIGKLTPTEEERERIGEIRAHYRSYNEFANRNNLRLCLNSQKTAAGICEYMSPFLYEPFFTLLLSVPAGQKVGRRLYLRWEKEYYPNPYRRMYRYGVRTSSKAEYFLRRCTHYAMKKLRGKTKYDMNPFSYWEKHDPEIVRATEEMFASDMRALEGRLPAAIGETLRSDWSGAPLVRKTAVLTASWMLKKLWGAE